MASKQQGGTVDVVVKIVKEKDGEKEGTADEYEIKEEVGRGAFSSVHVCTKKLDNKLLVAKIIDTKENTSRMAALHEARIMRKLGRHQNLVSLYDFYEKPGQICLIMDFVEGGELFERIVEEEFLTEEEASEFICQILSALDYMHKKHVLHLDLKPENILCKNRHTNDIKLVDFGVSKEFIPGQKVTTINGTADFVAPEIVKGRGVSPASDLWSVGVVTYALLSGFLPFSGETDKKTLQNVSNAEWDFDDECFDSISDEAKDFVSNLLRKRPESRNNIDQCQNHPWMRIHRRDVIYTPKYKKLLAKRRWKKSVNVLVAIRRISISTPPCSRRRESGCDDVSRKDSLTIPEDPWTRNLPHRPRSLTNTSDDGDLLGKQLPLLHKQLMESINKDENENDISDATISAVSIEEQTVNRDDG